MHEHIYPKQGCYSVELDGVADENGGAGEPKTLGQSRGAQEWRTQRRATTMRKGKTGKGPSASTRCTGAAPSADGMGGPNRE
eukprot:2525336-Pyramimonas_sp.AAC.1